MGISAGDTEALKLVASAMEGRSEANRREIMLSMMKRPSVGLPALCCSQSKCCRALGVNIAGLRKLYEIELCRFAPYGLDIPYLEMFT